MLRPGVDLELADLRRGEPVLREHALDRLADDLRRPALELLAQRALLQPAGVAGVPAHHLRVELVPRHVDLLGVHDDHEVAGVDVGGVLRLALAAQRVGDLGRESAQGLALGVDEVPVTLDLARLGGVRLHPSRSGNRGDRRRRSVAASRLRPAQARPAARYRARMPRRRRGTGDGRTAPRAQSKPRGRRRSLGGPRRAAARTTARPATSSRVGAGCRLGAGWVGTMFHSSTSDSSPSSARTRWTIVAVASAGPVPVSWRSDVNGMPETRAPR